MANLKISQLDPFSGNVQNDDLFEVVDVSDSSMAPTGTNKKVTWQDMKADLNDTYLRLNGANGPLTGDIDTQNLLPDSPTAQIGTEQAPYLEVNAERFKMSSDPGGFWAIAKSPDPANKLQFIRDAGAGQTIPYTLATTGVPTDSTDLATKAYVDAAGATGTPDEVAYFDGSGDLTSDDNFKWDGSLLTVRGRMALVYNNSNVVVGFDAMASGDLGQDKNVAIGLEAGKINTGDDNVFVGWKAGSLNVAGNDNCIIGSSNSGGGTRFGLTALGSLISTAMQSDDSTLIGRRISGIGGGNQIVIGSKARGRGTKATVIGRGGIASGTRESWFYGACNLISNLSRAKGDTGTESYIQAWDGSEETSTLNEVEIWRIGAKDSAKSDLFIENNSSNQYLQLLAAGGTNGLKFFDGSTLQNVIHTGNIIGTAPASSTAVGDEGTIIADANALYICVAANTWRKVDLQTF